MTNEKAKYRPFKNMEECCTEMVKHKPFGYLRYNDKNVHAAGTRSLAVDSSDNLLIFLDCYSISVEPKFIFERFTFIDGTPFGIKEEG